MTPERQAYLRNLLQKLNEAAIGHDIADVLECMEILKVDLVHQARVAVFAYIGNVPRTPAPDKDKH